VALGTLFSLHAMEKEDLNKALIDAVAHNEKKNVASLLAEGADPNCIKSGSKQTPHCRGYEWI